MKKSKISKKRQRLINMRFQSKKWFENDLISAENHVNQLFRIGKLLQLINIKRK
jgi:hypothetical protein